MLINWTPDSNRAPRDLHWKGNAAERQRLSAGACLLETLLPDLPRVVVIVRCPRPHLRSSGAAKRSCEGLTND